MTRLWWVRHGPTHVKRMVGWTDVPADLSDTARIAALRAALPDAPIISSDLLRARQTADAIQDARRRLPHTSALREFHYGAWENRGFDAIDSPALRDYFERPGGQRAPGGESWDDVAARVTNAVARLAGAHSDLILVAHMGVILTQWAAATGLRPYNALAQKIDNLSLTRMDWDGTRLHAVSANHKP